MDSFALTCDVPLAPAGAEWNDDFMSLNLLSCITVARDGGLPHRAFVAVAIKEDSLHEYAEECREENLTADALAKRMATERACSALEADRFVIIFPNPDQCRFEKAEKFEEIVSAAKVLKRWPDSTIWLRSLVPEAM